VHPTPAKGSGPETHEGRVGGGAVEEVAAPAVLAVVEVDVIVVMLADVDVVAVLVVAVVVVEVEEVLEVVVVAGQPQVKSPFWMVGTSGMLSASATTTLVKSRAVGVAAMQGGTLSCRCKTRTAPAPGSRTAPLTLNVSALIAPPATSLAGHDQPRSAGMRSVHSEDDAPGASRS